MQGEQGRALKRPFGWMLRSPASHVRRASTPSTPSFRWVGLRQHVHMTAAPPFLQPHKAFSPHMTSPAWAGRPRSHLASSHKLMCFFGQKCPPPGLISTPSSSPTLCGGVCAALPPSRVHNSKGDGLIATEEAGLRPPAPGSGAEGREGNQKRGRNPAPRLQFPALSWQETLLYRGSGVPRRTFRREGAEKRRREALAPPQRAKGVESSGARRRGRMPQGRGGGRLPRAGASPLEKEASANSPHRVRFLRPPERASPLSSSPSPTPQPQSILALPHHLACRRTTRRGRTAGDTTGGAARWEGRARATRSDHQGSHRGESGEKVCSRTLNVKVSPQQQSLPLLEQPCTQGRQRNLCYSASRSPRGGVLRAGWGAGEGTRRVNSLIPSNQIHLSRLPAGARGGGWGV